MIWLSDRKSGNGPAARLPRSVPLVAGPTDLTGIGIPHFSSFPQMDSPGISDDRDIGTGNSEPD